jgi:hypothetical protein
MEIISTVLLVLFYSMVVARLTPEGAGASALTASGSVCIGMQMIS